MCGWGLPVPSPYKLHFSNASKHLEDFVKRILRVVRRQVAHKHISLAIDLQTGSKQHVTNDVMVNKNIAVTSHPPAAPAAAFASSFRYMKTGCGCCLATGSGCFLDATGRGCCLATGSGCFLAASGRVQTDPCCEIASDAYSCCVCASASFSTCCGVCAIWSVTSTGCATVTAFANSTSWTILRSEICSSLAILCQLQLAMADSLCVCVRVR